MDFSEITTWLVILSAFAMYLYLLWLLIKFAIIDGSARGVPGWLLSMIFLLGGPFAWLLWLLFRPPVNRPPEDGERFDLNNFRKQ